jgi:hypothetical protein
MSSDVDRVVHAYGIVAAGTGEITAPGIAGTPVELLLLDDLAVVFGRLPASAYGERAWAEHGEDPAWLEPVAVAHHGVLQRLLETGDVLPLRLPGIYPDLAALARHVDDFRDDLLDSLHRVAGQREWSVQVFVDWAGTGEEPRRPRSGRDYLESRRRESEVRESTFQQRQLAAIEVHEGLTWLATAAVANRPQDRALSGRDEAMLLNSAFLVARDQEEKFLRAAEDLDRSVGPRGAVRVQVTGPWPAYNFAAARHE